MRAGLAQEYVKVSREQAKVCESHIHDQHLQHQVREEDVLMGACDGLYVFRAGPRPWLTWRTA